jgi:capsular polysaccharide transport system permease protein
MNMHGIMTPVEVVRPKRSFSAGKARDWVWQHRVFMTIVVLPSLLVGLYLYLIASDQYESEAHFIVRSSEQGIAPSSGVSQALSLVTGSGDASQSQSMSVADYLTSHDAVDALRRNGQLVERFHRPDADFFSRLRSADPTPERLLKYFNRQVKVKYNTETGITTLTVESFRPQDSYDLVRMMLHLGEQRVNILNQRSYNDAIALSRGQLAEAESKLEAVQGRLTNFRQARRDIDPQASGQAQLGLVTTLTGQLSAARAQLNAMGSLISHSSPQYQAVQARVAALQAQVGAQAGRLTGGQQTIANDISGYEGLRLRQEFLAKRYEAAAASLERARETAQRQQLYLVRVVDPNMPVKSLYPQRFRILATVVIVLLLIYSIGWLIVAGVREHAA